MMVRGPSSAMGGSALLACVIILAVGCSTNRDSPVTTGEASAPSLEAITQHNSSRNFMDLCWPISSECQHREMTTNEHNRMVSLGMNINTAGDSRCSTIKQKVLDDLTAGNVFVWTVGPSNYDPANYYGDRHNVPNVTHVTALALASNEMLMKTLIHEAAHAIGVTTDEEADGLQETCAGDWMIP